MAVKKRTPIRCTRNKTGSTFLLECPSRADGFKGGRRISSKQELGGVGTVRRISMEMNRGKPTGRMKRCISGSYGLGLLRRLWQESINIASI